MAGVRCGFVPRPLCGSPTLETIALKCLAKQATRRYVDCQALADDLRRFLDGKPVLARRPGRIERLVRWARRRPAAALASFTGPALLVAVTIFSIQQVRLNEQLRQEAKLREEHAQMSERQYRVSLYGKSFDRALLMWQTGDINSAREILEDLAPGLASWEWDWLQKLCIRKKWQLF